VTSHIDLSGQRVLITGGTKGVGRGIGQCFERAGARVAVCARKAPEQLPEGWLFVAADLRDGEQAARAVDEVVEAFGGLDVVVNNAGGSPPTDTATAPARLSERIIALNLFAPLHVSQRANYWMQQQDTGGAIINIGSVVADRPSPLTAAYGAAKAGLVNLTMTMAVEFAPKVRTNIITCGMIRTEQSHLFYGDEDGIAAVGRTVPLGRLAEPDEIGNVAVFLASDLASYVNGANVAAHGGGERPAFLEATNAAL
jgi:NAD(P)-dependent dehydrogenase (short-subunit alcohol dehydrogenase family)